MAILIALGICQWPWQKSKEGRPKCLEERLLGPKLEINWDQWHSGGHEVYVFSQGRDRHHRGDTGGQEALQSPGLKGHRRRGTGGVTIHPRGKVSGSGCWAPSGYLSGYSEYLTQIPMKNYLCKTVAIIRVYLERGRENNPAACPRCTGPLSKCLQNK